MQHKALSYIFFKLNERIVITAFVLHLLSSVNFWLLKTLVFCNLIKLIKINWVFKSGKII